MIMVRLGRAQQVWLADQAKIAGSMSEVVRILIDEAMA